MLDELELVPPRSSVPALTDLLPIQILTRI
jgi:hypothetical protein